MNKRTARPSSKPSSNNDPVLTPASTSPSDTPQSKPASFTAKLDFDDILRKPSMDNAREENGAEDVEIKQAVEATSALADVNGSDVATNSATPKKKKKKSKCMKHSKHSKSSKKAAKKDRSSSESSSEDSSDAEDESCSESSDESSSEDERRKLKERKRKTLKKKKAAKAKDKKRRKAKRYESDSESDSDSSDSSSDSESEEDSRRRRRRSKKSRKAQETESESEESAEEAAEEDEETKLQTKLAALQVARLQQQALVGRAGVRKPKNPEVEVAQASKKSRKSKKKAKKRSSKRASTMEYKRVDQLWDSTIHNYKLTESAEDQVDEFNEYVFTVRRKFDWENKYRNTVVDIKSKPLREALAEVMKDVKGVSLVEEQPSVDPNMLFLYLEEIYIHYKKTLKAQLKKEKKRKIKKRIALQIAHCKLLVSYLDEDYEDTKKTLYPMLKAGNITFDLLWALFKPNSIAYTPTYGSVDDPRCFKVDYANKESNFIKGEWYCIEGRYLEYDGKHFGLGDFEVHVESFKGPRKITSLATYPLKYHKDPKGLKTQLVERGKRFVAMQGMNYRFHKGLAFQKKKKMVAKVNINGRVMVDPAIFRRINPNYPISLIKPKDTEDPFDNSDDECSDCCDSSSEDGPAEGGEGPLNYGEEKEERERTKIKVVFDKEDKVHVITVPVDEDGREIQVEKLDSIETKDGTKSHQFSEEELLIASPVVLGFAFSEKLWLEFSLSGIRDIEWNEGAFSSLVLPAAHKSIVKGMVSSHKFHAAETIDDVVQGKGRGLVFVLHGPPGVGKTLTAEGIAEYLKCPLYAVSAGELGTDSRMLEHELQKIMDIAHSWGAVLLLDEADVFLEKREVHDIHRNALVSIFLRLLEYFQGILFLTTNRVETFDDAFQSRIHMPLRYGELTPKAKKEIWKTFIEKVRVVENVEVMPFSEKDYDALARNNLNGRQIKNAVRTAQSLAISEKERFSLEHIKRVLEVAEDFDHDLRGGSGYLDAMRSYT